MAGKFARTPELNLSDAEVEAKRLYGEVHVVDQTEAEA